MARRDVGDRHGTRVDDLARLQLDLDLVVEIAEIGDAGVVFNV